MLLSKVIGVRGSSIDLVESVISSGAIKQRGVFVGWFSLNTVWHIVDSEYTRIIILNDLSMLIM